jgi:hypothetical protein
MNIHLQKIFLLLKVALFPPKRTYTIRIRQCFCFFVEVFCSHISITTFLKSRIAVILHLREYAVLILTSMEHVERTMINRRP